MALRNSVIIRVCMGIYDSIRWYRIVQIKGKNTIDTPFIVVYNLHFYGVWRRLRMILASFSFSVFLCIDNSIWRGIQSSSN